MKNHTRMNSALASIGKNLILVGIVTVSAMNFFYAWLNWRELVGMQSLVGLAYIFLSCYEFMNTSYRASLPVQRYPYFSSSYVMVRTMKIGLFVSFGLLLFIAGGRMKYIFPICMLIAATETIITYLKYKRSLCFVNIYANYLLLVENSITRIFASEIVMVEFRHDIFYFVKRNGKAVQINLEHIRHRENFIQAIHDWLNRNKVMVSAESRVKIEEQIFS